MNNNDWRFTTHLVYRLIPLLIAFIPLSDGALYPYGPEYGDSDIKWPDWKLGSEEIDLDVSVPLLGDGKLTSVWVNTLGALTYNQLMDPRFENLINNIALSPYFSHSQEGANGAVYYRQTTTDQNLLQMIKKDITISKILPGQEGIDPSTFSPTWVLLVTWNRVASTQDEFLQNTFQIALATDGTRSFAIYNYDDTLPWNSANGKYAATGLFVVPDAQCSCSYALVNSQTEEVSDIASALGNSNVVGRFVFIISEPLQCVSKFESACGDKLPYSDWGYAEGYFSITGDNWHVYAQHTCKPGLNILPDVVSERIDCVYEPDYYESEWSKEPAKCIDLNATRIFDVEVELLSVGNDTVLWIDELNDKTTSEYKELSSLVVPAVTNILMDLGIKDVIVTVDNFSGGNDAPQLRSETQFVIQADVKVFMPTYVHKKLTAGDMETLIRTSLETNNENTGIKFVPQVVVIDQTDRCLQGCLCRNRKDPALCRTGGKLFHIQPDSCCGGCNGKPYSQTIKACCNDEHLYDPTKSTCCNGRIRKGSGHKCPKN